MQRACRPTSFRVARNLSDGHLLTGGWDDATGEDLIEQIAAVGDYQVALEDLSR
jgi:hypothetical protein